MIKHSKIFFFSILTSTNLLLWVYNNSSKNNYKFWQAYNKNQRKKFDWYQLDNLIDIYDLKYQFLSIYCYCYIVIIIRKVINSSKFMTKIKKKSLVDIY